MLGGMPGGAPPRRPPVGKPARKCEETGCIVQPTFGYPGMAKRFCGRHKLVGMLDLKSKRCEADGCIVVPSFGYEGHTRQFCGKHKLEGMVNMRGKRCEAPGCTTSPSFGFEIEGKSRLVVACHRSTLCTIQSVQSARVLSLLDRVPVP
jgi:EsV-1-7 cysteine-rich motif